MAKVTEATDLLSDPMAKASIESDKLSEARRCGIGEELRLVLIGMTGAGKSATGNTILNEKYFDSKAGLKSVTRQCRFKVKELSDRQVLVVDTPGFLDTTQEKDIINREIKKCIGLSSPGPHAFLLVTSTDRFTEQHATVFNEIDAMFGENLKRYLIVVFTHKDNLEETSIDEFTSGASGKMNEVLSTAGGGFIAFNNKGNNEEKQKDVKTLLNRVEWLIRKNNESHFTSEMFEEAEKIMQKRIKEEQKKKERREQIQKEQSQKRKKMEMAYYQKLEEHDETKCKEIEELKMEREETMKTSFSHRQKYVDEIVQMEFEKVEERDEAKCKEMEELKMEREKTMRTFYSHRQKYVDELLQKEFEKIEIKKKLTEKQEEGKDEDGADIEQQLAEVKNEIEEIVAERERAEEDIIDEILAFFVRMEEREKIENNRTISFESFLQMMGNGEPFLKFFQPSTKSWIL